MIKEYSVKKRLSNFGSKPQQEVCASPKAVLQSPGIHPSLIYRPRKSDQLFCEGETLKDLSIFSCKSLAVNFLHVMLVQF